MRHPSQQHAMLPMSEAEEAAMNLATTLTASGGNGGCHVATSSSGGGNGNNMAQGDHCPKHGGPDRPTGEESSSVLLGPESLGLGNNKESGVVDQTSSSSLGGLNHPHHLSGAPLLPPGHSPQGPNSGGGKKQDPKEIMKKRRERAICIDRVSRVIFPSTFILLNIIYWLVFSEILDAIKQSVGSDMDIDH